jgi:transposase-like protein
MDPYRQFCHNPACPARGQVGQGNIRIHSRTEQRYRCRTCRQTFAATAGTPFYRLQRPTALVTVVLTLLSHGCPLQAIVAAFALDERTVASWLARAGAHGHAVHEHLIGQGRIDLQHVQADELWVKLVGRKGWMAMALGVPTRLWLGGVVSPHRDLPLITTLVGLVAASARRFAILACVDGLASYVTAFRRAFRHPGRTGQRGRPRLVLDPGFLLGQVGKRYAHRHVISAAHRAVQGTAAALTATIVATGGGTGINTASIERLNATFRAHLAALVRRGRALRHQEIQLTAGRYLVGCAYNFCWDHESLRHLAPADAPTKWQARTPAMAAGLTDHPWSMSEFLHYQIPLPAWVAPKRRGRPPKSPPTPALAVAA